MNNTVTTCTTLNDSDHTDSNPSSVESSSATAEAKPYPNYEMDYKLMKNDYPYAISRDITHLLLWTRDKTELTLESTQMAIHNLLHKSNIHIHNDVSSITLETGEKTVESQYICTHGAHRHRRNESEVENTCISCDDHTTLHCQHHTNSEYLIFINPPHLQSVKNLKHAHVFFRTNSNSSKPSI